MPTSSRFQSPSASLALKSLLRRTQETLWLGSALAIAGHAVLTQLTGPPDAQRAAKPLTTQFVKRQPRLTKPLELKKRPQPKQRSLQRKMVAVKARADRQAATSRFQASQTVRSLAEPSVAVARGAVCAATQMEPLAMAHAVGGTREHESKVDMSLEMMDVDALDTGQYKAMVVQDPNDKRMVRGFLHLGVVYCESIAARAFSHNTWDTRRYIVRVVDAMNKYTDIETDLRGYYSFSSREMLQIPWAFVNTMGVAFTVTRFEATNLGLYLSTGGFLFLEAVASHSWEGPSPPSCQIYRPELMSGQTMLKDALATAGYKYQQEWTFEKIPSDHPLYHCYFDFDGPLPSYEPDYVTADDAMHGITIDGRLLMIFETGDYERFINDGKMSQHTVLAFREGTRHREFMVNVVIFALTQEGSLTHRLMNTVSY